MNKFRASFTTLQAWSNGDLDKAIRMYFHLEQPVTPAMEFGLAKHKEWEEHIAKTSCLPKEFGNAKMSNPCVEDKTVIQIEDWLELVGRPDCVNDVYIEEFKTGSSNSLTYVQTMQLNVYQILMWSQGRKVKMGRVHHFNQYTGKTTVSYKHLTKKTAEDGFNWILTYASEMHDYFIVHNLYKELGVKNAVRKTH